MAGKTTLETVSQKIDDTKKLIDDLTSAFKEHVEREADRDAKVLAHDTLLVGDGKAPSMSENLRNVIAFQGTLQKILMIIAGAFIGEIVVVGVGFAITIIQVIPILSRFVSEAPQLVK